jgi:hypothetical protein
MSDAAIGLIAVGGVLILWCLASRGLKSTLFGWGISLAIIGYPLRTQLHGVTANGSPKWTGAVILVALLGTLIVFVMPDRQRGTS